MSADSLKSTYQAVPIDAIVPSPYQARQAFDEEALQGLAASMKQQGLIEPIVVRPLNPGALSLDPGAQFELISGERRWRAAKLLGWKSIEAKIIATKSEGEAAIKGLIENVQRMDLNAIEEAEAFKRISQMDPVYWTQGKIAEASGKSRSYVNKSIALLDLSEEVKGGVRQRTLSREHGIELLRLINTNQQKGVAKKAVQGGWSVKETRQEIDDLLGAKEDGSEHVGAPAAQPLIDPLAKVWQPLLSSVDFAPDVTWDVQYKNYAPVPGAGALEGWVFFAKPMVEDSSAKVLAFWFRQMATALEGGKPVVAESQILKEHQALMASAQQIVNSSGQPRVPRTAAEEKELLDIAVRGTPNDVFAWIQGPDHLAVKAMPPLTWKEYGMPPEEGTRSILTGFGWSPPPREPASQAPAIDEKLRAMIARRKAFRNSL